MYLSIYCFLLPAEYEDNGTHNNIYLLNLILRILKPVIVKIIEICKEHKGTTYSSVKLLTNIALKQGIIKLFLTVAVMNGIAPLSLPNVMGLEISPFLAVVIADIIELGLKFIGYEGLRVKFGKWGNIGIGAVTGGMVGGIIGISIGSLVAFGIWVIIEAIGRYTEKTLS